jgi:hypothetical protein
MLQTYFEATYKNINLSVDPGHFSPESGSQNLKEGVMHISEGVQHLTYFPEWVTNQIFA